MISRLIGLSRRGLQCAALTGIFALTVGCETPKPVPVTVPGAIPPTAKAAVSGVAQNIADYYTVNADCTSAGIAIVKVLDAPAHGALSFVQEAGYTNFNKDNQRFDCNKLKIPMIRMFYTSAADFSGSDSAKVMVIYAGGNFKNETFDITVK